MSESAASPDDGPEVPTGEAETVRVTIDGATWEVPADRPLLAALDAIGARGDDVNVPHYCWHPKLSVDGSCRICQVEIEGQPGLQIACNTPVRDGMVVHTRSERVRAARRSVMELLLLNHPLDCPICDQAGECGLQDYAVEHGSTQARTREPRRPAAKAVELGPHIVFDQERCILCRRCVRFCHEVTGTSELGVFDRGDRSLLDVFPGRPLDNAYSMNTADICPVGALTTREFRFKIRVWFLEDRPSLCTGCARGCSVWASRAHDKVYRYKPRRNDEVNGTWICDAGRLTAADNGTGRLSAPRLAGAAAAPEAVLERAAALLRAQLETPERLFALVSAHAPSEDMVALAELCDALGAPPPCYQVEIGAGDDLLLHPEKAPNAAGARALGLEALGALPAEARLILALGPRVQPPQHEARVLLFDSHESPALASAEAALPLASHLEREGTFTNAQGLEQTFDPVVPAPAGARTGQQWLRDLARAAGIRVEL